MAKQEWLVDCIQMILRRNPRVFQIVAGQFKQLKPFGRHIRHIKDFRNFDGHIVIKGRMSAEEIKECSEKSHELICAFIRVKAVFTFVDAFESPVETLYDLLEPAVFF